MTLRRKASLCLLTLFGSVWLAPAAHSSPIKLSPISADASAAAPNYSASKAIDGSSATSWNAGTGGSQWIRIDLGKAFAIGKIRLLVGQSPAGNTTHEIWVGETADTPRKALVHTGRTEDSKWIEYKLGDHTDPGWAEMGTPEGPLLGKVRYLKVLTTSSPSWVAWREIEIYSAVEYFGFFGDELDGADNSSKTIPWGANLSWVESWSLSNYGTGLQRVSALGGKAVLGLGRQLLTKPRPISSDNLESLLSDVAKEVSLAPPGTVAAICPIDEPYDQEYTPEELAPIVAAIRLKFPNTPIFALHGQRGLNAVTNASYFSMFDWVGFDCYLGWEACNVPALTARLRSFMNSSQRLVAVPWSYRYNFQGTGIAEQDQLIHDSNLWQSEITSDATYIAILPFLWQSGLVDENPATGTDNLPLSRERLRQLMRTFLYPSDTEVYAANQIASSSYSSITPPFFSFDNSATTAWNAGPGTPATLTAVFGGNSRVSRIDYTINQTPSGRTRHVLEGLMDGVWKTLTIFDGTTSNAQTLSWTGKASPGQTVVWTEPANITQARMTTTNSPSWVSWSEVHFYR